MDVANIDNHHMCRLGKWYYTAGKMKFAGEEAFKELDSIHALFHKYCTEAIRKYQNNEIDSVNKLLPDIEATSYKIINILEQLKKLDR